MNNLEFNQGKEYVPLFAIAKADTSLKKLSNEEICDAQESIQEYLNDDSIQDVFPMKIETEGQMRSSQHDILNLLSSVCWKIRRNNNTRYLVTQYGLFKFSRGEVIPLFLAVIPAKYVKFLKMSSLIEESFPPEVIQVWINKDHNLSQTFYKSLKDLFFNTFGDNLVAYIDSKEFFKYLFVTYTKPSFLMQSQEIKWKQELLDGFRKEK